MRSDVFVSGFGGQGVLLAGNLLAYAAILEGKNVSFFPAYGVEKRGGAAMCTVVMADGKVGSPIIGTPAATIVLNQASFDKYAHKVKSGGILIVNSSLVDASSGVRDDVRALLVPMNEVAMEIGDSRLVNMVAVGVYVAVSNAVGMTSLEAALLKVLPERNHKYIPANMKAIDAGARFDSGDVTG